MNMDWATRLKHLYNEQYYEWGKKSNYSWYDNYHWEPERSYTEADTFLKIMNVRRELKLKIVDFGCAKGFFVRAILRDGYDAYGIDISDYARDHCDPLVQGRLFSPETNPHTYQYGFVKDVLEHVPYKDIDDVLTYMADLCPRWMIIVPLGKDGKYLIPEYELEMTHIIREDIDWWVDRISNALKPTLVALWILGIKDKWFPANRQGNLVLVTG